MIAITIVVATDQMRWMLSVREAVVSSQRSRWREGGRENGPSNGKRGVPRNITASRLMACIAVVITAKVTSAI